MSGIDQPGMFFPHKRGDCRARSQEHAPGCGTENSQDGAERQSMSPWETDSVINKAERRMYIFGALKAALLIGFVFIAGIGLLIALLLLLWT